MENDIKDEDFPPVLFELQPKPVPFKIILLALGIIYETWNYRFLRKHKYLYGYVDC